MNRAVRSKAARSPKPTARLLPTRARDILPMKTMMTKGEQGEPPIVRLFRCLVLAVALLVGAGLLAHTAPSDVDAILRRLEGLPLEEFFEASFREIMLRDPEAVSSRGLAERLGVRNDQLSSLDPLFLEENYELEQGILTLLRAYDRIALPPEQRLWYDTYAWYLERWSVSLEEQLRHPLFGGEPSHSVPATLEAVFFRHPLRTPADVEDYLFRIRAVPTKVAEIIDLAQLQIERGFTHPKSSLGGCVELLDRVLGNTGGDLRPSAVSFVPAYQDFVSRIRDVEGALAADREEWIVAAQAGFAEYYIPALWELREYVRDLAESTTFEPQTGLFADDRTTYEAELRAVVSTNRSPEAIHTMARRRVGELAEKARAIAEREGAASGQGSVDDFFALFSSRCTASYQMLAGERLMRRVELVEVYARRLIATAFEGLQVPEPEIHLTTEGARASAPLYYLAPSVDETRPGTFYIGTGFVSGCAVRRLYYHELIPGHHLQFAQALALDAPLFIKLWSAPGFAEGWATYCETLMEELGGYGAEEVDRLYGLLAELLEAIGAVLETGFHALGWTRQMACNWLAEEIGLFVPPDSEFLDGYATYPVDYTIYFVGRTAILRLRDRARQVLGPAFALPAFHDAVIGHGNVPLVILDRLVSEHIAESLPSPYQDEASGAAIERVTLWR